MKTEELNRRLMLLAEAVDDTDTPSGLTIISMFLHHYLEYIEMDLEDFISGLQDSFAICDRDPHNSGDLH